LGQVSPGSLARPAKGRFATPPDGGAAGRRP